MSADGYWGECYVYVIGIDGGPLKIGVAKDVNQRLKQLQNGNPLKLHIRATLKTNRWNAFMTEQIAHWLLRSHRLQGEWFRVTPSEASIAVRQAGQMVARGEIPATVKAEAERKRREKSRPPKEPKVPKTSKYDPLAANRYRPQLDSRGN